MKCEHGVILMGIGDCQKCAERWEQDQAREDHNERVMDEMSPAARSRYEWENS